MTKNWAWTSISKKKKNKIKQTNKQKTTQTWLGCLISNIDIEN